MLANITPLRDSSDIFQDITELKRIQQERESLLHELALSLRSLSIGDEVGAQARGPQGESPAVPDVSREICNRKDDIRRALKWTPLFTLMPETTDHVIAVVTALPTVSLRIVRA